MSWHALLQIAPLEVKSSAKHMWWKGLLRGEEAQGASEEERRPLHTDEEEGGGNDLESVLAQRDYRVYELNGDRNVSGDTHGPRGYERQQSDTDRSAAIVVDDGARKSAEEMLEALNRQRRRGHRPTIDRRGSGELSRLSRTSTANSSQNSPRSQSDDGSSMHQSPGVSGRISGLDLGDRALPDDGRGFAGSLTEYEGQQGRQDAGPAFSGHPSGLPNGLSRVQFMERFQSNVHDRLDQWDSSTARELLRNASGAASSTGTPPNLDADISGLSTPSPLNANTPDAPKTLRNIPRPGEDPSRDAWFRSLSGAQFTDSQRGRGAQEKGGRGRDGGYERLAEGRRYSESSSRASDEQYGRDDSSRSEEPLEPIPWDDGLRRDGLLARSMSSRQSSGQTSDGVFPMMSRQSSGNSEGSSRALIMGGRDSLTGGSQSTALALVDPEEPSIDFKKEEENYQLQVGIWYPVPFCDAASRAGVLAMLVVCIYTLYSLGLADGTPVLLKF